jgi:hypothetical protein
MPFRIKRPRKEKKVKRISNLNPLVDVIPDSKYRKPINDVLMVFYKGSGGKIIPVQRLSSELLRLPNGEILYAGVEPQPIDSRLTDFKSRFKEKISVFIPGYSFSCWRGMRMHYSFAGYPFTHNPQNMEIISTEKKRSILLETRTCIPVNITPERTVYILISKQTGFPFWKEDKIPDEWKKKDEDGNSVTLDLKQFYTWIDSNKDKLDKLEIADLPVKTEYDVTSMEMLLAEANQIAEGKVLLKYNKAQDEIGDPKDPLLYFIIGMVGMFLTMVIFLWAGSEGVFA